jgi:hypothetical protein
MNAINLAIKNLESVSHVLEKVANSPENYNASYAGHLENISWEMHKHANELREMYNIYSDTGTECKCANGCMKCLGMSWKDFY